MATHGTLASSRYRVLALVGIFVGLAACSDGTTAPTSSTAPNGRTTLPSYQELKDALSAVQDENNGGLGFDMWGTIVDREGVVQAVAFTGATVFDQWPAARALSAQKANTANGVSLPAFALSTANLYAATQPGGSLFGLQESNPVDESVVYAGPVQQYGTAQDPMVGKKPGGINVFGGGLALYASDGTLLGALGVSGDLSCADHIIAWKVRDRLGLDFVPAGVSPSHDDNIIFDLDQDARSGFGHPSCNEATEEIGEALPTTNPISTRDAGS